MKKMIILAAICLPVFFLKFTIAVHAQGLSSEDIKAQMVKDWERSKAYTIDYLNTMPADKYSFRAHDSIRSFAQQMLHIAQANFGLMAAATDQAPPAYVRGNMEQSAGAQKKDSVMYYVVASYDFCISAIKSSDPAKWSEKKKFYNFEETRYAFMNKTFEHQGHHRGQTTVYIRLQGIKPPQERLF
jgi:uncharacterized damage-inducible protein DinB